MLNLDVESLVRFDDTKPAVHPLADSGHARVMLLCVKAGQVLKDHRSTSQVIFHFVRGRAIVFVDGVPQDASAGSLLLLEPNRFHRVEAQEDCVALVIMAPHPAREGYPRDQIDRIISRTEPAR
jgi:quercetin dioxygenase-like cupin family protein